MRDMYIQRGDGFVMVYSVSSEQSPDRLRELNKQITRLNEGKSVIISILFLFFIFIIITRFFFWFKIKE